jgi:hypothetical protein
MRTFVVSAGFLNSARSFPLALELEQGRFNATVIVIRNLRKLSDGCFERAPQIAG